MAVPKSRVRDTGGISRLGVSHHALQEVHRGEGVRGKWRLQGSLCLTTWCGAFD